MFSEDIKLLQNNQYTIQIILILLASKIVVSCERYFIIIHQNVTEAYSQNIFTHCQMLSHRLIGLCDSLAGIENH